MRRSYEHLTPRTKVYDRWWPDRLGVIVKRLKTRLDVLWSDGDTWRYDQPHMQFLEKAARRG
jgi:hypothetical protein